MTGERLMRLPSCLCLLGMMLLWLGMASGVANGQNETSADRQAIADVLAGRTTTAEAAWWGFDPDDATRSLQAAFDSPAKTIVVADMGSPWVVTTIRLPSHKKVLLRAGVVIEAKPGAFLGKGDCLFVAQNCQDLQLIGPGAVLRMHKQDYMRPPYEPAEWRHALSLRGCENVVVEGLTLRESGGDGIYLGTGSGGRTNRRVTLRNIVCDSNHRQGMSVITAEDLLVENCVFRNTRGTAPQAGVDFEPNRASESLVNCVLRNCRSYGNVGAAYHVYLGQLGQESKPVSIRFEKCSSRGCARHSMNLSVANREGRPGVRGTITCRSCRFDSDAGGGVYIRGNEADACRIEFNACEIIRPEHDPLPAPIVAVAPASSETAGGNLHFQRCVLRDAQRRRPLELVGSALARFRNVSGTIDYQTPGDRESITLDEALLDEWYPNRAATSRIPVYRFDWRQATRITTAASASRPEGMVPLRRSASLLCWCRQGEQVLLRVRLTGVGRAQPQAGTLQVQTGDGEPVEVESSGDDRRHVWQFTPPVAGAVRVDWRSDAGTVLAIDDCSTTWAMLGDATGLHLLRPRGTLYFAVPGNATRFALLVEGAGSAETVKATIRDAERNVVAEQDNIGLAKVWAFEPQVGEAMQIWSISLDKATSGVLEDVTVQAVGIPNVFAITPDQLFTDAAEGTPGKD